ncbi:FtsX-like permease family protein [Streptosporangium carneum]|uniref:ABC3 transporter permease C-terminal domain-containing protein n=1 Tax=Streptosporangium carneum TaxID=47481 RepID=A0A9W6I7R1_9ACTN|nr:FtsX-like permease family protein [Streptosporangium carneum]GLK13636.1 hypothetical protein GCM10017600_70470 [Streptosporangium carneum]
MSALLAALRISRRDIGRARARSALIVVMIGLPVLAMTAALTLFATDDIRLEERLTMELGVADARLVDTGQARPIRQSANGEYWEPGGGESRRSPRSRAEIQALAGPGARAVPMNLITSEYWAGDAYDWVTGMELDLRDRVTNGMFPLLQGRYPQAADEVVVTASLRAAVGTTIRYTRKDTAKRVVGRVVEQSTGVGASIIGLPGSLPSATSGDADQSYWLLDTPAPVTWAETLRLNRAGVAVLSPAVLADPPPTGDGNGQALDDSLTGSSATSTIVAAVMGIALAVIEVVLLAGPAFAVGIRRRRRELALISAQGGSGRHLKLVVLADGLTLGLVAAVLGSVLGLGVARAVVAYRGSWPEGDMGPFEVPAGQIALVAALGLFSGVAAAVVPAVQAARADAVVALAGRRAETRDRAGWPLAGLVLLGAGVAAMLYGTWSTEAMIFFGGVLGLLGLVMLTPRLVRLIGGLAGGLPLPLRLAVRDASRNRGRTAPAVVAVLAAAAAFSTVAVGVTSSQELARQYGWEGYPRGAMMIYGDDVTEESWKRIRPIVAEALAGVPLLEAYQAVDDEGRVVDFAWTNNVCERCTTRFGALRGLPAGGPDLLRFLMGRTDPAAEAALAAGKAVIFHPKAVVDGEVSLSAASLRPDAPDGRKIAVPAVTATVQGPSIVLGVMPVSAITKTGFTSRLGHLIVDPAVARLTSEQRQRLGESVRAVTRNVEIGGDDRSDRVNLVMWVMAALASVVVLGGTFAAAGLAAADARPDLSTLSAVGAPPWTRRTVAAGQAVFVAGLGVPLGLLVGLVPGFAMASQSALQVSRLREVGLNGIPYPKVEMALSAPWLSLVAVGVGLPLAAGLIALVFARTGVTLTRRTG